MKLDLNIISNCEIVSCRGGEKMKNEQKDNKEKITFICFLAASICFYISAIFCFISETADTTRGIVNLCLGSAFLCLSSTHLNKDKRNDKNQKGE